MRIESSPEDQQKERLEDWLTELTLISRKYQILIDTTEGDVLIVDLNSQSVIGVDLALLLDAQGAIVRYDADSSILDGVWPVETAEGLQEQRTVGAVWPRRPGEETSSARM